MAVIQHIVVIPDSENVEDLEFVTLLQGFNRKFASELYWALDLIAHMPRVVEDIYIDRDLQNANNIHSSSFDIKLIGDHTLHTSHYEHENPLTIIYFKECSTEQVLAAAKLFSSPPLLLSDHKSTSSEVINILDSDLVEMKTAIKDMYTHTIQPNSQEEVGFKKYLENYEIKLPGSTWEIDGIYNSHNCTRPLLFLLLQMGCDVKSKQGHYVSNQNDKYIGDIISLTNAIDNRTKYLLTESGIPKESQSNEVIVFCPSIYSAYYKSNSSFWNKFNRALPKESRVLIKDGLIRNKGYSNSSIEIDSEKAEDILKSALEAARPIFHERAMELNLFTSIITTLASKLSSPAIRLPNSVMLHHDILKNIGTLAKSGKTKSRKSLLRKISHYQGQISSDIGSELLSLIAEERENILAVCDFPIEWTVYNNYPIMLTHEISRVSTTPGNLSAQQLLRSERILLPHTALTKILIIRSFSKQDPISRYIEDALKEVGTQDTLKDISYEIVDVKNTSELVEAINNFEGAMVVFDCHGDHGGEAGHGWLKIGNEKVDVWDLSIIPHVPPIVLLSACSTHPLDGSHASVANGFLSKGAISVLGTYGPVNSVHSAIVIARLILRISLFLPIASKNRFITWRTIISGFFRMSYTTDILQDLVSKGELHPSHYQDVHLKLNTVINSSRSGKEWSEKFPEILSDYIGKSKLETLELISDRYFFTETMLYNQLGRPENLVFIHEENYKEMQ